MKSFEEKKMKRFTKNLERRSGFTIVELLTVMSIIILLTSILVPGLHMAKKFAKEVRQNTQFYHIQEALELFNTDEDGYPLSYAQSAASGTMPDPNGADITTGAHHLAEALLGRDMQGYDPLSTWNAAYDTGNVNVYAREPVASLAQEEASRQRRKGPYLELKHTGAFQVNDLYRAGFGTVYADATAPPARPPYPSPVLTDIYRVNSVTVLAVDGTPTVVKAGTPILYYKANTTSRIFYPSGAPTMNIYNYYDNLALLALGHTIRGVTSERPFIDGILATGRTGPEHFYDSITNPLITPDFRPYNQDSYILMSAGYDGIFGTNDDISNFGQ